MREVAGANLDTLLDQIAGILRVADARHDPTCRQAAQQVLNDGFPEVAGSTGDDDHAWVLGFTARSRE